MTQRSTGTHRAVSKNSTAKNAAARNGAPVRNGAARRGPRPARPDRAADGTPFYLRGEEVTQIIRPVRKRPWRTSSFGSQVWVLTARSLRTVFGNFKLVFFGLLQPIVLLLLFSQVFKSIASLPSMTGYHSYVDFLMPATLVNIAMTTAMGSGAGVLTEIYTGFIGRLRAMPINMFAVLVARTLSDAVRLTAVLVVIVLSAVVFLDFRPSSVLGIVAAVALSVVVGWGLGWLFVAIATWQSNVETMQAVSFIVMFPLMFVSSGYMPIDALPTWLRMVARANPLTYAIDAERELALGQPLDWALPLALGLVAAAALVGSLFAAHNFRRAK